MLVTYLRNDRVPYACIVAIKQENDAVRVGWSQCHPKDKFNKKLARQIAYNRAVNGWNSHPADDKINTEMQHMLLRADNYFYHPANKRQKSLMSKALALFM